MKTRGASEWILIELGWGGMAWIGLAQDGGQWRALVNTVMNHEVQKMSGRACLHEVDRMLQTLQFPPSQYPLSYRRSCIFSIYFWVSECMAPCPASNKQTNKLHGLSPRANYTDQVTAACRRSDCQLLRIEGAMWSA
jgi:hypothetical protein